MPGVSARGLALQAAGLSERERGILGLLVVWILEPVLEADQSEAGQQAMFRAQGLWQQAWDSVINDLSQIGTTEKLVASSDELQLSEEPNDASVYRLDFLAALLYALRACGQDSQQNLSWCLQRVSDSFEFLEARGLGFLDRVNLDKIILEAIQRIEAGSGTNIMVIERVRDACKPVRDIFIQALQSIDFSVI